VQTITGRQRSLVFTSQPNTHARRCTNKLTPQIPIIMVLPL